MSSRRSILDLEEGEALPETPPATAKVDNKGKPNDKLRRFRDLVGINPLVSESSRTHRPAENTGTYKRLVDAELKARVEYYATASIINVFLLGQIVIAAALTALGASSGSHIAITVLGSVNTVVAGGMTYLKGQGLPDRLVQYANELRKVREHLEERERQFAQSDCSLNVDEEVEIVLEMYSNARRTAEESASSNWKGANALKPGGKSKPKEQTETPPNKSQPPGSGIASPTPGLAAAENGGVTAGNKAGSADAQEEASGNNTQQRRED